ncbi:hypothetical protein [Pseudactinotalea terrae]|uniref:hypothetical protein n=1 Tax=Pseudactinotalea terrae TaxID=1743262 RepID=UPI0012E2862D|nr:hypothetical protein [Pseudactinotalea terrae]
MSRDPREEDNARYGSDPAVRLLAVDAAAGLPVDLTVQPAGVVRHVALALSVLTGLRAVAAAPVRIDRCQWSVDPGTGVLTFRSDPEATWCEQHGARLVAAAAAGMQGNAQARWFDLWEVVPDPLQVPVAYSLAAAANAPLIEERTTD